MNQKRTLSEWITAITPYLIFLSAICTIWAGTISISNSIKAKIAAKNAP